MSGAGRASPGAVAFLVESADLARGGAERASLTMARELARRGIEVGLVAPADRGGEGAMVDGVRLERFELQSKGRANRARELAERAAVVAKERGFVRLISCGKILGAELWWPHGGLHARARAASVTAGRGSLRGGLAALGRKLRPVERVFDDIEAELHEAVRDGRCCALAISEMVRDHMAALGLEASVLRNGCAILNSGQDSSGESSQAPDLELNQPSSQPSILELSQARSEAREREDAKEARERFASEIGLDPIRPWWLFIAMNPRLKGLDRLHEALAMMAGLPAEPGSDSAEPQILGVGAAVNASPAGFRSLGYRDDVPALLQAADGLVLPTHYDPCSLVTLEAMAAGRAIITTRANGAAELLEPGVSVELASSAEELATTLARLSADKAARAALGTAAREAARRWTVRDAGDALLAALAG